MITMLVTDHHESRRGPDERFMRHRGKVVEQWDSHHRIRRYSSFHISRISRNASIPDRVSCQCLVPTLLAQED